MEAVCSSDIYLHLAWEMVDRHGGRGALLINVGWRQRRPLTGIHHKEELWPLGSMKSAPTALIYSDRVLPDSLTHLKDNYPLCYKRRSLVPRKLASRRLDK